MGAYFVLRAVSKSFARKTFLGRIGIKLMLSASQHAFAPSAIAFTRTSRREACTHKKGRVNYVAPTMTRENPQVPPPPPGREDEFADANGDSLEESSAAVATISRDPEKQFDTVLQELVAIQQDGPRNVAILGTRYTSFLHQQIIELLTYANVLVGNHVFTSGAGGTNAAVIRGALRAEKPDLLTVVLPQSLHKQPFETQEQVRIIFVA